MDKVYLARGFFTILVSSAIIGLYIWIKPLVVKVNNQSSPQVVSDTSYAGLAEFVGELGPALFEIDDYQPQEEVNTEAPMSVQYLEEDPWENDPFAGGFDASTKPAEGSDINFDEVVIQQEIPAPKTSNSFLNSSNSRELTSSYLEGFLNKLYTIAQGKGKLRIAYFGDSMIEGDLITQTLRNQLQRQFGGRGVGFIPINSPIPGFRKTVKHEFSKDWVRYFLLKPDNPLRAYGISGEYFTWRNPGDGHYPWVKYTASPVYPSIQNFPSVILYYGSMGNTRRSASKSYYVVVDQQDTVLLNGRKLVNRAAVKKSPSESIHLEFKIPEDSAPLFGVSVESQEGIIVDNFPSRGNTGVNLLDISPAVLEEFQEYLDYDLVILQFGLNLIKADRMNYTRYENRMKKVVSLFKAKMPGSNILMIGVSDKGTKINGKLNSDPSIPYVINSQAKVAKDQKVAFFNLFEAMGGEGTMIRWAESSPPLGKPDYAHFTELGAEKAGFLIYSYLMDSYRKKLGSQSPL